MEEEIIRAPIPRPPCFWEKRLQALENKGNECGKEREERKRGGKLLRRLDLPQRHGDTEGEGSWKNGWRVTPPGVLYGCERKGFAEIGICMNMKTRAIKIDGARKTPSVGEEGRDETGTLSAEPWARDYRIRYYLSSEKLKAVD